MSCKRALALVLAACAAAGSAGAMPVRTATLDPERARHMKEYFSRGKQAASQGPSQPGRRLHDTLVGADSEVVTDLTTALEAGEDGVGLRRRPLRVSYDVTTFLDPAIPAIGDKLDYIENDLLPALGSLLSRSIRVRIRCSSPRSWRHDWHLHAWRLRARHHAAASCRLGLTLATCGYLACRNICAEICRFAILPERSTCLSLTIC